MSSIPTHFRTGARHSPTTAGISTVETRQTLFNCLATAPSAGGGRQRREDSRRSPPASPRAGSRPSEHPAAHRQTGMAVIGACRMVITPRARGGAAFRLGQVGGDVTIPADGLGCGPSPRRRARNAPNLGSPHGIGPSDHAADCHRRYSAFTWPPSISCSMRWCMAPPPRRRPFRPSPSTPRRDEPPADAAPPSVSAPARELPESSPYGDVRCDVRPDPSRRRPGRSRWSGRRSPVAGLCGCPVPDSGPLLGRAALDAGPVAVMALLEESISAEGIVGTGTTSFGRS